MKELRVNSCGKNSDELNLNERIKKWRNEKLLEKFRQAELWKKFFDKLHYYK